VMVTHDPKAAAIADRLLFLSDGQIVKDLAGADENQIVDAMKDL
jgi:putative ABC transport system ATP-binding protein